MTSGAPRSGVATAALVLGIIAVGFALVPLVGLVLPWLPALLAIILGAVGASASGESKAAGLWGVVLGFAALPVALIVSFGPGLLAG